MLKIKTRQVIDDGDWDDLVRQTYGKPYCFQQQSGCQERGVYTINVSKEEFENHENEDIPLEINGDIMGVTFDKWLNTDPKEHEEKMDWKDFRLNLFWERNFYPDIDVVANDLCRKGLLPEGEYDIKIDW